MKSQASSTTSRTGNPAESTLQLKKQVAELTQKNKLLQTKNDKSALDLKKAQDEIKTLKKQLENQRKELQVRNAAPFGNGRKAGNASPHIHHPMDQQYNNLEDDFERQLREATQQSELHMQQDEQDKLLKVMNMAQAQASSEEERLLALAMAQSQEDGPSHDPNAPDVDNMTYEQLCELGDKAGYVSKGLKKSEIMAKLKQFVWVPGKTKTTQCAICMEDFQKNEYFRKLPKCNHEFHRDCIDEWLKNSKECPVDRNAI